MANLFIIVSDADPRLLTDVTFPFLRQVKRNNWMDQIRLIFWGPSQKTIVSALELKSQVMDLCNLLPDNIYASQICADDYHIGDKLEELGVTLVEISSLVNEMLHEGWKQLTF